MASGLNLLYVEDDINIRQNYCFVLKNIFDNIYEASNYDEAMELYKKNDIQIAMVDIKLDGYKTGIDLIQKIRLENLNIKIIVISAYSSVENLLKLSSLNLSSFLVKPIEKEPLLESINIAIKESQTIKILKQDILELGEDYIWDFSKKELHKKDMAIGLTKIEKNTLQVIFSNPSMELSYGDIIQEVWDYDDANHIETLRTIVYNLRKKLPKKTIKTLYNIGYRFK